MAAALLPLLAGAQAAPRFEASVSRQKVNVNSSFELTFTLFDAEGSGFRPPNLADFQVEAGPSTRINASIVNGKITQESSYVFILRPRRAGIFTIGSASVQAGGRNLQTKPVRIEVTESKTTGRGEAFVEARPSASKAWVGQQIMLDYAIYLSDPSWSANVSRESDYAGFLAVPWENTMESSETVEGVEYNVLTERISLYPQKSGVLNIEPLELDVLEWKRDAFSPFGHSTKRMSIASEAVSVEVIPLPAGAPASFSGAVGRFLMNAEMNRTRGTTDETFALRMSIAGNGDMKRVEAPLLTLPAGLQGYDPKATDESAPRSYQMLTAEKTIEYLITALLPGKYEIRPEFSYFDTDSARYVTVFAGPFTIDVAQGQGARKETPGIGESKSGALPGQEVKRRFPWRPALGGAVLAVIILFLVLQRQKKRRSALQTEEQRLNARQRMALASKYLHLGEIQSFYYETAQALFEFCAERFDIPPAEWTKERIGQELAARGIDESVSARVQHILHTAEMALYARVDQSELASGIYRSAVEAMGRIEELTDKDTQSK